MWVYDNCWCKGIHSMRSLLNAWTISSSILRVRLSLQQALSAPKTHTRLHGYMSSCSSLSARIINYPHRCQNAVDIIVTGDGRVVFIIFDGMRRWWLKHTFAPEVRKWVIPSDATLWAIELWCIVTRTMQKTLCHLFKTRGNTIGMSHIWLYHHPLALHRAKHVNFRS